MAASISSSPLVPSPFHAHAAENNLCKGLLYRPSLCQKLRPPLITFILRLCSRVLALCLNEGGLGPPHTFRSPPSTQRTPQEEQRAPGERAKQIIAAGRNCFFRACLITKGLLTFSGVPQEKIYTRTQTTRTLHIMGALHPSPHSTAHYCLTHFLQQPRVYTHTHTGAQTALGC